MIEFKCAKCNAPMRAPVDSVGKKGRCSECGEIQQIPAEPTQQSSSGKSAPKMISFPCAQCGEELRVPAANAGKKGKCPKCAAINRIPEASAKKTAASKTSPQKQTQTESTTTGNMTFGCPECGQSITVPSKVAGKKGKCPQCKAIIPIPRASDTLATTEDKPSRTKPSSTATATRGSSAAAAGSIEFRCPQCDRFVKTPAASAGKKGKCPGCQSVFDIPHKSTAKQPPAKPSAADGEIPGLTPISDGLTPIDGSDGLAPLGGADPLAGGGLEAIGDGFTPIGAADPVGAADPLGGVTDPLAGGGLEVIDDGMTPMGNDTANPFAGDGLDSFNTPMAPVQAPGQASPYTPPAAAGYPSKPSSGRKKSLVVQIPAGIMIGVAAINLILRILYTVWTIGTGTFAAINDANFPADQQAAMQIGMGVGVAMLIGLFIVDALLIAGFTQMFLARRYAVAIMSLIVSMFLYVFPGCCCYFPFALPLNGIAMIAVIIGFVGVLMQDGKRTFID